MTHKTITADGIEKIQNALNDQIKKMEEELDTSPNNSYALGYRQAMKYALKTIDKHAES